MIGSDVMSALLAEKVKKESANPKKRYIPFLLDEWADRIEKPMGRKLQPDEAKEMICNLLKNLADGTWVLDTKPTR